MPLPFHLSLRRAPAPHSRVAGQRAVHSGGLRTMRRSRKRPWRASMGSWALRDVAGGEAMTVARSASGTGGQASSGRRRCSASGTAATPSSALQVGTPSTHCSAAAPSANVCASGPVAAPLEVRFRRPYEPWPANRIALSPSILHWAQQQRFAPHVRFLIFVRSPSPISRMRLVARSTLPNRALRDATRHAWSYSR